MANQTKPLNAPQQQARIDRGEEGDKVPGFDPSAAPLGTDEEAAGTPTLQHPARPPSNARPQPGFTPRPDDSIAPDAAPHKGRAGATWAIAVVIAAAVIALACFYAFSGSLQS